MAGTPGSPGAEGPVGLTGGPGQSGENVSYRDRNMTNLNLIQFKILNHVSVPVLSCLCICSDFRVPEALLDLQGQLEYGVKW